MKTQHTPGPWRHISGRPVTDDETQGYHVEGYFRDGKYLGPDDDGIYPSVIDAAPERLAAKLFRKCVPCFSVSEPLATHYPQ
jgi:hypothetical protein